MPTMDMPHIPQHQMPVVLAAQTTQPSIEKLYGSIGVCTVADKTDQAEREKKLGVRLYASTIFDHKNPHYRAYMKAYMPMLKINLCWKMQFAIKK